MRLGMNMLLWTTGVCEDHYGLLEELRDMGFDGVEIPLPPGLPADPKALGKKLDELGLARTTSTSLEPETNPVSPDPAVRQAAQEALFRRIEICAELGGETMCGPFHSAWSTFSGHPPTEEELARSAEVLHAAAEHAEQLGVRLAIEFLNRFECYLVNTAADARDLVRRVDHPALGILYDTHHAHIEEADPAGAIASCAKEIYHVHTAENHRGAPGQGQVDWKSTIEALKKADYDGWLVIEAFSTTDPAFAAAINVWRDYHASSTGLAKDGHDFLRAAWSKA